MKTGRSGKGSAMLPVAFAPYRQTTPLSGDASPQTPGGESHWRSLGEQPLVELRLPGGTLPTGWALVQGRLTRKSGSWVAYLHAELADPKAAGLTFELSATRKGTINEAVHLPRGVTRLCLEPMQGEGEFSLEGFHLQPVGEVGRLRHMYLRVLDMYTKHPRKKRKQAGLHSRTAVFRLRDAYRIAGRLRTYTPSMLYPRWIEEFDTLTPEDHAAIRRDIARLRTPPRFSVLVLKAANDPEERARGATMESLLAQLYANFDTPRPAGFLRDSRDTWHLLLPAGVALAPHALYWLARAAADNKRLRLIYSDHDFLNEDGQRCDPVFKPDWSPELLRSTCYIGHAVAFRGDLMAELLAGQSVREVTHADLHGLLLRAAEVLPRYAVRHVHAPLFHMPQGYQETVQGRASPEQVAAHLERQGLAAAVEPTPHGHCRVRYALPAEPPLVSIIVPTKDCLPVLRNCVASVLDKTAYRRFELLIVDNQSAEPATLRYLETVARHPQVRVLHWREPFNFSAINNHAASQAAGQALCLLNNDTEVISPDWLEEMLGHLLQPGVGAVGAKLYYTDGCIQHAGDAVGPGGCADHLHARLEREDCGYCDRAVLAQEYSAVTAACLLTWTRVYDRLGGLDAVNLPVAFNDVDYCLRVRHAGLRVHWTPYAELYHHESYSRGADDLTAERLAQSRREVDYMRTRWAKVLQHDPFYNPNLNYARPDFSLSIAPQVKKPWK